MENIKVKIWDAEPSELLLKIKEMLEKQKINVTRELEEEYDIVISSDNDYKNKKAIFIQGTLNPKCSNEILAYLSIIADKLDISERTLTRYESGISEPTISVLIKLSLLFNVSIDYIAVIKYEETILTPSIKEELEAINKRLDKIVKII